MASALHKKPQNAPVQAGGRIASEADLAASLKALRALDDRLPTVIDRAGPLPLRKNPDRLKGLVATMIGQQVSRASAAAIFGRLDAALDLDDPAAILGAPETVYRAAGLSRAKHRTILALALAVADGELDFGRIAAAPAEDAIAELVRLPGIGPWTAESYLLFSLGHPDVFPSGDLALQVAVADAFALTERPKAKALAGMAEVWAPYRATAARLFWAYYRAITARDAAPVGLAEAGPDQAG
ncbi:DNA-3-methyladenine glycosylase family protein [Consotaella aegiceratis]|uniref:DNA-3-methyladenine glycosylase family protein n=1 Tax=Consotaella aegiceratis TaxID=3097961 RepID=UPI002F410FD9